MTGVQTCALPIWPRLGNENDKINCSLTKDIIGQVDWDCKIFTRFSETNLGCGIGVSSAISWAFENEERLIILEDDTVPVVPFFHFCDVLLEKFKEDNRVWMISGNNYSENRNPPRESYFFSLYGHIWGWATWKRAWDHFDYKMQDWPVYKSTNQLSNVFKRKREQEYFTTLFDVYYSREEKGTWDYQWTYTTIKEAGLCIVPKNNLVTNIGAHGMHTNTLSNSHYLPVNNEFSIVNEPQFVLANQDYDEHHFKDIIDKKHPFVFRIIRKINRMFKIITEK